MLKHFIRDLWELECVPGAGVGPLGQLPLWDTFPESLLTELRLMALRNGSGCASSKAYLIFVLVTEFAKKRRSISSRCDAGASDVEHSCWEVGAHLPANGANSITCLRAWKEPPLTCFISVSHILRFGDDVPSTRKRVSTVQNVQETCYTKRPFRRLDHKAYFYCKKFFSPFSRVQKRHLCWWSRTCPLFMMWFFLPKWVICPQGEWCNSFFPEEGA